MATSYHSGTEFCLTLNFNNKVRNLFFKTLCVDPAGHFGLYKSVSITLSAPVLMNTFIYMVYDDDSVVMVTHSILLLSFFPTQFRTLSPQKGGEQAHCAGLNIDLLNHL